VTSTGSSDHVDEILAEWHAERPELDLGSVAVIGRLLRAARYLGHDVEQGLARFGLSVHEFNALSALRRVGAPFELTPTELGHALLFSSGGLTKLLERLAQAGLVTREQDTDDRRVVRVRLTESGRALQEEAMDAHLANQRELLAPLGGREQDEVAGALRALLLALEARERRPWPLPRPAARAR
jgi:DNA-binding MarR family transcriptional regulator